MEHSPVSARLPSGRRVRVVAEPDEAVEVRAPDGTLELRIVLGPDGPALQLRAVRMELVAEEQITLRAPSVSVEASDTLTLEGGDALALSATRVDGRADTEVAFAAPVIRLN